MINLSSQVYGESAMMRVQMGRTNGSDIKYKRISNLYLVCDCQGQHGKILCFMGLGSWEPDHVLCEIEYELWEDQASKSLRQVRTANDEDIMVSEQK